MNIGRTSSSKETYTFLILLLPSLVGIVILWISFPLITILNFIIKCLKKKVFNYQILIISFFYLIAIHFCQTALKNKFSKNFINPIENLVFYKNNYKKYNGDILPSYLDKSLKNIKQSQRNFPKNKPTTISTESIKMDENIVLSNADEIDEYYALKVTKAKFGFDTTKSQISDMNNLTFSTIILKFKIKCLLGIEKSCLCQSITKNNFIYYYGQPLNLDFIDITDVYFALTYILTLMSVITLFGINIHLLIRRNSNKANS